MTAQPDARTEGQFVFEAFGAAFESDLPLLGARQGYEARSALRARIDLIDAAAVDELWPGEDGTTVLERRHPDGALGMRVEWSSDVGYRIDAPGFGRFVIARDGSRIDCSAEREPNWEWHRPLFGQALPLAATLRGLELFHASGVAVDGRAVGFIGLSGAGKTSTAISLTARGGQLLTDDVLSVEPRADGVVAHPGTRLANVAEEQLSGLDRGARARLGTPLGKSDKVHVELASMPSGPVPLAALYYIRRWAPVSEVVFERIDPPDPLDLLGATFLPHVATSERLRNQLDVCARIEGQVPTFRLLVPGDVPASGVAEAVERHVDSLG